MFKLYITETSPNPEPIYTILWNIGHNYISVELDKVKVNTNITIIINMEPILWDNFIKI